MTIKKLKEELGLDNRIIAKFFNLTHESYQNSSAKKRYENALIKFYNHIKNQYQND